MEQRLRIAWIKHRLVSDVSKYNISLFCISGNNQESTGLVSEQEQHPIFRNQRQGGNQRGAGLPDYRTQRS